MSRHEPTRVNLESVKKALEELKKNSQNRQAYDLLVSLAEREKANIEFWESELKDSIKLNKLLDELKVIQEKIEFGDNYLKNSLVMSGSHREACIDRFTQRCNEKEAIESKIKTLNRYKENLFLFTVYKQYSDRFKPQTKTYITQEKLEMELITS